jgi:hypothetical protein
MTTRREPIDVRALVDRLLPDSTRSGSMVSSFVRGVTAGALIGAAIAGSALLQRRRARSEKVAAEPVVAVPAAESPPAIPLPAPPPVGIEPASEGHAGG